VTTTLPAPEARTAVVELTRLRALALQLEFVLRYTADVEWWLPQMAHGLETHWLGAIGVYGVEEDRRARALLRLDIDWTTHDTERSGGRFLVTFAKDKHPEGATNLVTATARWFRDVVSVRRLQTECRVALTDEVQQNRRLRARARKELSIGPRRPVRWVQGLGENVLEGDDPELPELSVTCTVVY
jgi:hypothetical protein